jgi:hypothetical protein
MVLPVTSGDTVKTASAARHDKWWAGLSPEQKAQRRQENRSQKRIHLVSLSTEEREKYLAARKAMRAALSPEERKRRAMKAREWRAANPEKVVASQAKHATKRRERYAKLSPEQRRDHNERQKTKKHNGFTSQQAAALLARQGGCAGCRAPEPKKNGWHIDHDHVTGRVRGILCGPCNMALGLVKDSPTTLRRLSVYVG